MNALCYKTVFSKRLGALVAVGEHATSQSKGQGAGTASGAWDLGSMLRYVGVLTGVFAAASMAWSQTLPQGGRVSQGQVSISQSGQQMDITQSTSKAVVNWDSFDIGTNAKVNVVQPNSQSVLLNRVLCLTDLDRPDEAMDEVARLSDLLAMAGGIAPFGADSVVLPCLSRLRRHRHSMLLLRL